MRATKTHAAFAMLAIAASACVVEVVYDPTGGPVDLHGTWTVNGQAPSAATCGPIITVRLVICDDTNTDCYADHDDLLERACAGGSLDVIDLLVQDAYYAHWEALDADGSSVAESGPVLVDVTLSTDATLAPIDLVTP